MSADTIESLRKQRDGARMAAKHSAGYKRRAESAEAQVKELREAIREALAHLFDPEPNVEHAKMFLQQAIAKERRRDPRWSKKSKEIKNDETWRRAVDARKEVA